MTVALGMDPTLIGAGEAGPADDDPSARRASSRPWLGLLLVLATGWGAFLSYSAIFLTDEPPQRNAAADLLESGSSDLPSFAIPPEVLRPKAAPPAAPAPAILAEEPRSVPVPPVRDVVLPSAEAVEAGQTAPRSERADYVGTWGPTSAACGARSRRKGYLPATITPEGARAGRTSCSFHDGHRTGNAWVVAAECNDRGRRWTSQVRLVVEGDRLTWTSAKGSAAYVRCGRRAG
ncbi:hypothetical protein [Methylobacterium sp. A54F]